MKWLLWADLTLISIFGIASGLYKVFQGQADIEIFSKMGMSPMLITLFGGIQIVSAVGLWIQKCRTSAAVSLALCNALASFGLFVAGVGAFAPISLLFVLMALLSIKVPPFRA
jgi:hypothetical protein